MVKPFSVIMAGIEEPPQGLAFYSCGGRKDDFEPVITREERRKQEITDCENWVKSRAAGIACFYRDRNLGRELEASGLAAFRKDFELTNDVETAKDAAVNAMETQSKENNILCRTGNEVRHAVLTNRAGGAKHPFYGHRVKGPG